MDNIYTLITGESFIHFLGISVIEKESFEDLNIKDSTDLESMLRSIGILTNLVSLYPSMLYTKYQLPGPLGY